MKKPITILILILLFVGVVVAQDQDFSVMSSKNSTSTTLDSNATFTGTAEFVRGFNSISVTVRSDSSGTYKVLFGKTSTITTANAIKTFSFSYTANDTLHTKHLPVVAPYFKVVYTSSADTQHTFLLSTMLHRAHVLPIASDGTLSVSGTTTVSGITFTQAQIDSLQKITTTGLATLAKQDSLLVQLKGANKLFGETDTITARTDTVTCTGASFWLMGSIIASDSIQVAINGSFTSGQVWVITETTKVDLPKWSAVTSNKLYIKRYGNVGTPRYYLRLSGR